MHWIRGVALGWGWFLALPWYYVIRGRWVLRSILAGVRARNICASRRRQTAARPTHSSMPMPTSYIQQQARIPQRARINPPPITTTNMAKPPRSISKLLPKDTGLLIVLGLSGLHMVPSDESWRHKCYRIPDGKPNGLQVVVIKEGWRSTLPLSTTT